MLDAIPDEKGQAVSIKLLGFCSKRRENRVRMRGIFAVPWSERRLPVRVPTFCDALRDGATLSKVANWEKAASETGGYPTNPRY
jgi:hypothetical protein